jgi:hypothetical protein
MRLGLSFALTHVLVLEAVSLYLCSWVESMVVVPRDYFYPILMGLDECWAFSRSITGGSRMQNVREGMK